MNAYALALSAALVWGIAPILEKAVVSRADPLACVLWRVLGTAAGGLLLLPFVPSAKDSMAAVGWRGALMIVAAGAASSVLGQVFMYGAIKRADVSAVSPVAASWPLVVLLLSWPLLKEPITWRKTAGCLLVVSGVWLLKPEVKPRHASSAAVVARAAAPGGR